MLCEIMKRKLKKTANYFGFQLMRCPKIQDASHYECITPNATYAPWKQNSQFMATYEKIKSHTLLDIYRCFELWNLVEQSSKLQGSLIEIGTWRGGSGAIIATRANLSHISDPVYLCDTFSGVVKTGQKDTFYKGREHSDTSLAIVEELIYTKLGLEKVKILQGIFPDDTARCIEDKLFRFCHIDVDAFRSAQEIVSWIWDKMTVGGVIVFDDYGFETCQGITSFVNEYKHKKDCLFLHNLNGHAIFVKLAAIL
ncbi:MAG: TylF/MycF/NovP-related O-methyltransferase [Chlamydiota bacterium]